MSVKEKLFAAEINPDIASIDLHAAGSIHSALEQLEQELFLFYNNEEPYCRVIHGIGSGKLANATHDALEKNPMILAWKCQGGSCLVVF